MFNKTPTAVNEMLHTEGLPWPLWPVRVYTNSASRPVAPKLFLMGPPFAAKNILTQ